MAIWKSRPRHNHLTVGVLLAIGLFGQPALCWPQAGLAQFAKANGGLVSGLASLPCPPSTHNQSSEAKVLQGFVELPISFEAKQGVVDAQGQHRSDGGYVCNGSHQVGFHMIAIAASQPQAVDQVGAYSTYLGARLGEEESCTMVLTQVRGDHEPNLISQAAPPPPGRVPPNASRVIATVLKDTVWPPGSLQNTLPALQSDQKLYSITVEIHASDQERSDLSSWAVPGSIIEAFSSEVRASDLVGKRIKATVKLIGETDRVRWWISNISTLP